MFKHLLVTLFATLLSLCSALAVAAVDVNKADQAALESVKGIGPAMSTRLMEERKKSPFKDWPDMIDRVKGIGPGNAAKFSENGLTVNGTTFSKADAPKTEAKAADTKTAKK